MPINNATKHNYKPLFCSQLKGQQGHQGGIPPHQQQVAAAMAQQQQLAAAAAAAAAATEQAQLTGGISTTGAEAYAAAQMAAHAAQLAAQVSKLRWTSLKRQMFIIRSTPVFCAFITFMTDFR